MKRIMVDIETMSVHNSNALILSVGAVNFEFYKTGPQVFDKRLWVLDLAEQLISNRHVSKTTQKWWAEQDMAAALHWTIGKPVSLATFCDEFAAYVDGLGELWANGSVFDIGNLASLWSMPPWPYNAVRDSRTVKKIIAPRDDAAEVSTFFPGLVQHDPISDCIQDVGELWRRIQ